jgi:predicted transcriptional regulator
METTKHDVLKLIEEMPDDASLEDILYRVYVRAAIQRGLDDARKGRTLSHEEVMKDITAWLQSAGH